MSLVLPLGTFRGKSSCLLVYGNHDQPDAIFGSAGYLFELYHEFDEPEFDPDREHEYVYYFFCRGIEFKHESFEIL